MPNDPWYQKFSFEVDPDSIDEGIKKIGDKLKKAFDDGRYTKVRFKYKGRSLLPDIPLGALVATELATFIWVGPLKALVVNLGVKTLIEIEFIHVASERVQEGQEYFQNGDVEQAEALYREALKMKPNDTAALYHLGVLLKVTGRKAQAIDCLERASKADHPLAEKAAEALSKMK